MNLESVEPDATMTVGAHELTQIVTGIYTAAGVPDDAASTVARHQVGADLAGHPSHGIQLLPLYIERIDKGHIVPDSQPVVISQTPTSLYIDGRWGFGAVVTEWTLQQCLQKAELAGMAVASIREQSHVGRLAGYVNAAARTGYVAMMMCDSGQTPKQVAPFGGREARLGTNPLAIAIPSGQPGPVCLDVATSAAAGAKLKVARTRKQSIPVGWLLDVDGNPTTDPNAFFAGGALLPLGGVEGHKGYGLSFAVETLSAILPGLGFGVDPLGRHNDGTFLFVFDPGLFRDRGAFQKDVDDFVAYLKQTPTVPGVTEVMYPGEIEYRTEQERRRDGIPLDIPTWQALITLAERFDIETDRH